MERQEIERAIDQSLRPLHEASDLAPLIDQVKEARIVMLGEATHGTQEFYEWRRRISQELIEKHGFRFIAVEGDWPPCNELNHYIRGHSDAADARTALRHFRRWPTWMWANTVVAELAEWMKQFNEGVPAERRVGFHGLDVYSLFESMEEVLKQLHRMNPMLERRIRVQYECFDPFLRDERAYVKSLSEFPAGCENQVLQALQDLLKLRLENADGIDVFDAQQNARVVANAEQYYRAMILGNDDSWNVRDRHMMETLDLLLDRYGDDSKAIVWAHNTHIGDYRATDMAALKQINIGGLAREEWGEDQVALVGFGTDRGQVIASHAWDGPIEIQTVPPGRDGSYESIFHTVSERRSVSRFWIDLRGHSRGALSAVLGHRAIGVVYNPPFERWGNYVPTLLAKRYDVFVYIDQTQALTPFEQTFDRQEIPETWPTGR